MNIPFFICIIAAILCVAVVSKRRGANGSARNTEGNGNETAGTAYTEVGEPAATDESGDADKEQFSAKFFERIRNGEESQTFLTLSYQGDCAVIQSLLQSADIPSFTEFEHFNLVKGGGLWGGGTGTDIKLSILKNDYDTAFEIVDQFIRNKSETLQHRDSAGAEAAKTTAALLAGSPVTPTQRILGITVYPKHAE